MSREYTEILALVERELLGLLPEEPDDAWFARFFGELPASPRADVRRALNAPAVDLVRRGGKRWRPLLLVLAARAFGREEGVIALAPLIEIAHDGTLIVDDIEDGSDMRRGGPAIHIAHGVDAAVNAGNLMYFLPLVLIDELDAPPPVRLELHARFAFHMRRLHLGQAMDIQWHRVHDSLPDRESYLAMCALKTGVLARAAAEFGAVAAYAPPESRDALGLAFEGAGVAFQILDDVRNLRTGNPGKKRGDDIVEGKKSLPVIIAAGRDLELVRDLPALFATARADGPDSPAVETAIERIERTGALDEAEELARRSLEAASLAVRRAAPPGPGADLLADFAASLAGS